MIAIAQGVDLDLPDSVAISTVTLCELHHGVLIASDETRPARLRTLIAVERAFDALPVDARVAPHYGQLVAEARRAHGVRPKVADALIAATALSHGLRLCTRDAGFERLGVPGLQLV